MLRRIYAIFKARNREFLRDRGTLAWNLLLPVALMFGLSFAFSNERDAYTVGVFQETTEIDASEHAFLETSYINFVAYDDFEVAMQKVSRHQLDLLVEFNGKIGIRFIDLAEEIERIIGFKVDLVSRNGLKDKYYQVIKADLIYV